MSSTAVIQHRNSVFPVLIDPSAIALKPQEPTPDAPFTFTTPEVVTRYDAWVRIVRARRKLVIIDSDLAALYGTTVDIINRTAMRNACCFPRSACFRLSNAEWHHLKNDALGGCGLAEADRGNWLCAPLVFTEEGAGAMTAILDTYEAIRGSVLVWRLMQDISGARRVRA